MDSSDIVREYPAHRDRARLGRGWPYAVPVRSQLRMIVFGVVAAVIVVSVIVERQRGRSNPWGSWSCLSRMLLLILRERRRSRS